LGVIDAREPGNQAIDINNHVPSMIAQVSTTNEQDDGWPSTHSGTTREALEKAI
jgi:hypothetical protein